MLKEVLNNIKQDVDKASSITKQELIKNLIQSALDKTHDIYCQNLKLNYNYLLSRNEKQVLKTIKREKEKEEKRKKNEDKLD